MTDDGLLGRPELERALTALGDRLVRRGVVADLFVVDGAAMALAYDARRVTRDVDATFVPHGVVLAEARNVAIELDLPPWWLNEQASVYVFTQPDDGRREVFDHPGLQVMAASPAHVFAMKAFAARRVTRRTYGGWLTIIGIRSVADPLDVCIRFFPCEPLPERAKGVLEDLFPQQHRAGDRHRVTSGGFAGLAFCG